MNAFYLTIEQNETELTLSRFDLGRELELEMTDKRQDHRITLYLTESQVREIIAHLSKTIAELPAIPS